MPKAQEDSQRSNQHDQKNDSKTKFSDTFWLRSVFPNAHDIFQYSPLPNEELAKTAIFCLDTNALLAPYQMSKQSAQQIDQLYRKLASKSRIFVPEQAAREFAKNRGDKLIHIFNILHQIESKSADIFGQLDYPMLSENVDYMNLSDSVEETNKSLKKCKDNIRSIKNKLLNWSWDDLISKLYRDLFTESRVINHVCPNDELEKDLKWRNEHQVPPGYKDQSKSDSGVGDLEIWHSILHLGKTKKCDVIFVTNDSKADWVYRGQNHALSPRIELCLEFYRQATKNFGILTWSEFIKITVQDEKAFQEAVTVEQSANVNIDNVVLKQLKTYQPDINIGNLREIYDGIDNLVTTACTYVKINDCRKLDFDKHLNRISYFISRSGIEGTSDLYELMNGIFALLLEMKGEYDHLSQLNYIPDSLVSNFEQYKNKYFELKKYISKRFI